MKRGGLMRPGAWLGLVVAVLLAGCGGESSVSVGLPGDNNGPTISGIVSMPNGQVAAAPSALQRVARIVAAPADALVAAQVRPVGAGVKVRVREIDASNVVNGRIRGGRVTFEGTTAANGEFSIKLPTDTSPETCRYVLEVGSGNALTRAFVDDLRVDVDFQSEAALRLVLGEIRAGRTTLCALDAGDLRAIRQAVRDSDRVVLGDTARVLNSAATAAASDDPGVRAAIDAALGVPTPPPTGTAPPSATVAATATAPPPATATEVPTRTATGAPTRTATSVPTRTATIVPTRTSAPTQTAPPSATATNAPTRTATAVPTGTAAATATATAVPTGTTAATATPTGSATITHTVAPSATSTPPPTVAPPTQTSSPSATAVPTMPPATATAPSTATAIPTATATPEPATVEVGIVAGTAGADVWVPVELAARGVAIAAVAVEMELPADGIAIATVTGMPDCVLDARLGASKQVFASHAALAAGRQRLRVGVVGLDNNALIASGSLFACRFRLGLDAAPAIDLAATAEGAGPQAEAIALLARAGRIDVAAAPAVLGLEAGTAAAGGTVAVGGRLIAAVGALAAVATDIRFDADALAPAELMPVCVASDAAQAAGKTVVAAPLPMDDANRAGLRIGVIGLDNATPLPDDLLFTCALRVLASSGSISLTHQPEGASPAAAPVPVAGAPGTIEVVP